MKKTIALLLALVLCLSLVACGNSNKKKSIVGKWECAAEDSVIIMNEDKTGSVTNSGNVMEFTWIYDESSHLLVFTLVNSDWTEEGTYMEDADTIYCDGWMYTRAAE